MDPVTRLARQAATEAIGDARLAEDMLRGDTTGVVFGTSKGGLATASSVLQHERQPDSTPLAPQSWLEFWPNSAACAVSAMIGCQGPSLATVAACATGLAACLRGVSLIQEGRCDVVLAGSSDASLQPAIVASFLRLGVLSRESENPVEACRPFDRNRSGFVIGEGAGCLILESYEHALRRKANWYGEWQTGAMLSDPAGLTQLDPTGASLRRLVRDLLRKEARLPDYINLHGTATATNDRIESSSIRGELGPQAGRVSCSSLKGGMGHLLGAAGSVELAATFLAIRDQIIPPTANLKTPDPALDLDFTPRSARQRPVDLAWKFSLGFGGHLSAASISRLRGEGDRTTQTQ